jgi:hypothetical protein
MKTELNVSRIPKGKAEVFAAGGKRKTLGKGDRTRTSYPAEPQRPGRTGQHSTSPALRRTGAKVRSAAVDTAGDMGGSPGASQPRRPAA